MSHSPTPLQRAAVRDAARWYARLSSGCATLDDHAQWQRWHDAQPLHQEAWMHMQGVSQSLGHLPAKLASATLLGTQGTRREVLYGLAMLMGGGVLGTMAWRSDTRREWSADYRSGVGELRNLDLADGSQLLMDTDSAVDVQYDAQQRLLILRRGQVLVSTASDPAQRPFMVETRDGRVLALGTRFSVRSDAAGSEVAVLEKAVELKVGALPPVLLHAGEHAAFGSFGIGPVRPNDASVAAWRNGSLIAIDQPLGQLIEALSRYRPGILRCEHAVASLRVSGAFPITDTDLALASLQESFPVQVSRRSRYWVTVGARA
ncbi:FecR domain-containing protein [Pseudomonas putida]